MHTTDFTLVAAMHPSRLLMPALVLGVLPTASASAQYYNAPAANVRTPAVPDPAFSPPVYDGRLVPAIVTPWAGNASAIYPTYGGGFYGMGPAITHDLTPMVATPWGAAAPPVYPSYGGGGYYETPDYIARQQAASQPPPGMAPLPQGGLPQQGSPQPTPAIRPQMPAVAGPAPIYSGSSANYQRQPPPATGPTYGTPAGTGYGMPGAPPQATQPGTLSARSQMPQEPVPSVLQPPGFQTYPYTNQNDPLRFQYGPGVQPVIPFYQPQLFNW